MKNFGSFVVDIINLYDYFFEGKNNVLTLSIVMIYKIIEDLNSPRLSLCMQLKKTFRNISYYDTVHNFTFNNQYQSAGNISLRFFFLQKYYFGIICIMMQQTFTTNSGLPVSIKLNIFRNIIEAPTQKCYWCNKNCRHLCQH